MPGLQADLIAGNSNWTRTNTEAKFYAAVCQAQRQEVTSIFVMATVQNQTWTNSSKYKTFTAQQTINMSDATSVLCKSENETNKIK